jgi:hypothetical protein
LVLNEAKIVIRNKKVRKEKLDCSFSLRKTACTFVLKLNNMKKDIEKINKLNAELREQIELKKKMIELTGADDWRSIDGQIEKIKSEIYYEEHRRAPNDNVKVKFIESDKVFYNKTAIGTYKQSINEFGTERVKPYFPDYFARGNNETKDYVALDINTYLYARVSCEKIKKNIEAIADKLGVRVTVTIIKKSP